MREACEVYSKHILLFRKTNIFDVYSFILHLTTIFQIQQSWNKEAQVHWWCILRWRAAASSCLHLLGRAREGGSNLPRGSSHCRRTYRLLLHQVELWRRGEEAVRVWRLCHDRRVSLFPGHPCLCTLIFRMWRQSGVLAVSPWRHSAI